jgi:hypothetical protein
MSVKITASRVTMLVQVLALIAFYIYCYQITKKFFFIDEIFLINAALFPREYPLVPTFFGYLVHPLLEVSSFDLVLYRRFWIGIFSAVAFWFAYSQVRFVRCRLHKQLSAVDSLIILLTIFSACLYFINYYTGPTPSYTTVTFIGVLFCIGGLAFSTTSRSVAVKSFYILSAAVGIFIALTAKPPAGVLLAAISVAWILLLDRSDHKHVYAGLLLALLAGMLLAFLHSVFQTAARLIQFATQIGQAAQDTHSVGSLAMKVLQDFHAVIAWYPSHSILARLTGSALVSGFIISVLAATAIAWRRIVLLRGLALLLVLDLSLALGVVLVHEKFGIFNIVGWSFQVWVPWIVFAITSIVLATAFGMGGNFSISRDPALNAFMLLCVITPFVSYIGTSTRAFAAVSGGMAFFVLAFVVWLLRANIEMRWTKAVFIANANIVGLMLAFSVWSHMNLQWHVRYAEAVETIEAGLSSTTLHVTHESLIFYQEVSDSLRSFGFEAGTSVITSGISVYLREALFVSGGKMIGHPLLYNIATIGFLPWDDIRCSWVILPEAQSVSLRNVLNGLGRDFSNSYLRVGELRDRDGSEIPVFKPTDESACGK